MSRESIARTLRSLRRSPGFVAIATLSLGTALGLSTAVFALMDAMTHPEAPYGHVDQLRLVELAGRSKRWPSRAEVEGAWRGLSGVTQLATVTWSYVDVEAGESVERVEVAYTRPGLLALLEVRPRLGRLPRDDEAGAQSVAVVSDALWRRKFSNNRVLAGARVSIADHGYSIVGVMPDRATVGYGRPEVWIPDPAPDRGGAGSTFIRLKDGVTDQEIDSQLKAIAQRFTLFYNGPPPDRPFSAWTTKIRPDPLQLKDFHRAMIGAALCVLLIACANVAALMLARGIVRRRDYALRLALGAGRAEVAR